MNELPNFLVSLFSDFFLLLDPLIGLQGLHKCFLTCGWLLKSVILWGLGDWNLLFCHIADISAYSLLNE